MKKLLILLAAIILLLLLLAAGGVVWLQMYVQSPQFVERIKRGASERLGTQFKFDSLAFNVLSGFDVKGVKIEDPPPNNSQNFLVIEELRLRYSPYSLIRGKMLVNDLDLRKPDITVRLFSDGSSNIPLQSKKTPQTVTDGTTQAKLPIDFTVRHFQLSRGRFELINADTTSLFLMQDASAVSNYETTGGGSEAKGDIRVQSILLGSKFLLTDCTSTLTLADNKLDLPNVVGKSYQGTVSGEMAATFGPGEPSFKLNLRLMNADVGDLLTEFGSDEKWIQGKLTVTTQLEGSQIQPRNLTGSGDFEIPQPNFQDFQLFRDISLVLGLPDLGKTQFKHLKGNFKIENQRINFLSIEAVSDVVQFTASGTYAFDGGINFDVGLAIAESAAAGVPSEIRDHLIKRDDGFYSLTFNVSGTASALKTNLAEKFAQQSVQSSLEKLEEKAQKHLPEGVRDKAVNILQNILGGKKDETPEKVTPAIPVTPPALTNAVSTNAIPANTVSTNVVPAHP